MSYILEKFGTLTLSQIMAVTDISGGVAQSALTSLASGGAYNALGSRERARGKPITVTHSCILDGSGPAEVQTKLDACKAWVGVWDKLYRLLPDGSRHYITAELLSVNSTRKIENRNYVTITMTFASLDYYWHGDTVPGFGWMLDSGYYFDNGMYFDKVLTAILPHSNSLTLTNNGNYPVRNAILEIACDGGSPSGIMVVRIIKTGQTDLTYSPLTDIVQGQSAILNCGKCTVQNNGVDDYPNLFEWLCVDPGVNTLDFTMGPSSATGTITIACEDGWE